MDLFTAPRRVLHGVRRVALFSKRLLKRKLRSHAGMFRPAQGATPGHTGRESHRPRDVFRRTDLPELSFDIGCHNPVGWLRTVRDKVGALGPPELLPVGSRVDRVLDAADRRSIRGCHHLVDIGTFHPDPRRRAQTLVRLMAAGTPIHVLDHEPELRHLLGAELYELAADGNIQTADTANRERVSIKMRRIALRDHSTWCHVAGLPSVSILLATRRPRLLEWMIANVARQNYPRLELVLGLHGTGFEQAAVDQALAPLQVHSTVIRVADPKLLLGSVLNAATAAASGTLLSKMDDDDLYDQHHIWDLVLAHAYSKAELVGKRAEAFYLAQSEKTLRRRFGEGERFAPDVAGNSLLVSKQTIDEIKGWPYRMPEDRALIDAVLGSGSVVYRTHGHGLFIVRHGKDHTWRQDENRFLATAEEVHDGWRPSIVDCSSPPLKHDRIPG